MNWDALHSPNAKHYLIHLLGINLKNGILLLPSWLWLGISHPIHLTKQEGKFEANNGKKEEKS
jgi:hypothetical protein